MNIFNSSYFNNYKIVYIDYGLRLAVQFLIISIFIKTLETEMFSLFLFYGVLIAFFSVIVNSSFDALINRELAKNNSDLSEAYFSKIIFIKIIFYLIISITSIIFIEFNKLLILFIVCGFFGVILEHQDVKLRFINNYTQYVGRIILSILLIPLKIFLSYKGELYYLLVVSIVQVIGFVFLSQTQEKIYIEYKNISNFILLNYLDFRKTIASGSLIFLFLFIDQVYVYYYIGKDSYVVYALTYKFYNIANGF